MPDWAGWAFDLKKVVTALILLPGGPLIAIAFGLWLSRSRRRAGVAVASLGLVVLVAGSLPVVANALVRPLERDYPPLRPDASIPADSAIVVLGGGMQQGATDYGGETVNPTTLARLRSGARLAARTRLPILVTGGRLEGSRTSEGEQMAEALENDFRTPVRWVEKRALDTADNARFSTPLLEAAGIRTVVLVTDVGHMERSRILFEAAGMGVIPAPTDYYADAPVTAFSFLPSVTALRRSAWTIHDWVGLQWNRLRRTRGVTP